MDKREEGKERRKKREGMRWRRVGRYTFKDGQAVEEKLNSKKERCWGGVGRRREEWRRDAERCPKHKCNIMF